MCQTEKSQIRQTMHRQFRPHYTNYKHNRASSRGFKSEPFPRQKLYVQELVCIVNLPIIEDHVISLSPENPTRCVPDDIQHLFEFFPLEQKTKLLVIFNRVAILHHGKSQPPENRVPQLNCTFALQKEVSNSLQHALCMSFAQHATPPLS